jgi:Mn2+/Fe2+ NRAMP family transporter
MILIMLFVAIGNYQTNQKIFLTASFLFVAYIISAVLAKPDWNMALRSLMVPTDIQLTPAYIYAAIALMGTTITPWGQFFISSYINDKKLHIEHLRYEQFEIWAGAFITDFFAFFIIVAVAATLHVNGISIVGADDAALAIKPFAGEFAGILFGIGLLTASYMGAVIIPLTTAYAFSEFFGTEGSLDLPFNKSKIFYGIFLIQIVIAFFAVLIPGISLFQIVLFTQSLNGVLLPFIIYFLLKFTNDKEIMGQHTNNAIYNIFATLSAVVIVVASIFVIVGGVMGMI